jgi:hypothetical protein
MLVCKPITDYSLANRTPFSTFASKIGLIYRLAVPELIEPSFPYLYHQAPSRERFPTALLVALNYGKSSGGGWPR